MILNDENIKITLLSIALHCSPPQFSFRGLMYTALRPETHKKIKERYFVSKLYLICFVEMALECAICCCCVVLLCCCLLHSVV